jgi:hypothetical protein
MNDKNVRYRGVVKESQYIREYFEFWSGDMLIEGKFVLLKLMLNTIDALLRKGRLSYPEARRILKDSLDPRMSDDEKEEYLDNLVKPSPSPPSEDEKNE